MRRLGRPEVWQIVVRNVDVLRHDYGRRRGQLRVINLENLWRRNLCFHDWWQMPFVRFNQLMGTSPATSAHGLRCRQRNRRNVRWNVNGSDRDLLGYYDLMVRLEHQPHNERKDRTVHHE